MAFAGIPHEAVDFYEALEADNSRAFWTAHRETYEQVVRAPIVALCDVLGPEFGEARLFRPYRDVRFAKDKSPYKTHQGAAIEAPGGAVLYLHVGPDGLLVAAGQYGMAADQLQRFRAAVDSDVSGPDLVAIVDAVRAAGHEVGGDTVKTRPRGVRADHPRLELMRHRSLHSWHEFGAPEWLATPRTAQVVAGTWRQMAPLGDWLGRWVGPSSEPTRR